MAEKTVRVPAISCGHCLMTIKREVGEVEGVTGVDGDVDTKQVTINFDAPADWVKIAATLKEIGYPAEEA
ncbi:MAG: heavy-metal-associated domain-containing protein [Proteobacteria bacterium]|nr:heavy-metal-associated domain-containing protein [Pseudomonadota bacterium]